MEHRKRSSLGGDEDDEDGDRAGKARPWNPYSSSRIVRVSRASGGKDRHSKVLTAKGLRDRRVRLSVSTAIQFYDLQDRLGVDQPSKAVDWLIRAAEPAIAQLPSLPDFDHNNTSDAHGGNGSNNHQCSSTSETSKGSGSGSVLSLSRTDIRVRARERAKERAADRERSDGREEEGHAVAVNGGANLSSQSSFTELLAGGGGQMEERKPMTADYFVQFGVGGGEQLQQFSYLQEHVIPMEYGINFSLSSGLAGLGRGTLQSNSSSPSSHFPHHQHHHHHHGVEGGSLSLPFFFGAPASAAAGENQFSNGFGGRYGDGYSHSELKGKGKA